MTWIPPHHTKLNHRPSNVEHCHKKDAAHHYIVSHCSLLPPLVTHATPSADCWSAGSNKLIRMGTLICHMFRCFIVFVLREAESNSVFYVDHTQWISEDRLTVSWIVLNHDVTYHRQSTYETWFAHCNGTQQCIDDRTGQDAINLDAFQESFAAVPVWPAAKLLAGIW